MNTDNINRAEYLIQLYYDNEISRDEEIEMFDILSGDEASREYFKRMSQLEKAVKESKSEFPQELEYKIFSEIRQSSKKENRIQNYLPEIIRYAAIVLLFITAAFMYFQNSEYKSELKNSYKQIKQQEGMINNLINTLPEVEINSNQTKEIVIVSEL